MESQHSGNWGEVFQSGSTYNRNTPMQSMSSRDDEIPIIGRIDPISSLGKGTFGKVVLARVRPSSPNSATTGFNRFVQSSSPPGVVVASTSYDHAVPHNDNTEHDLVAVKIASKGSLKSSSRAQRAQTELRVMTEVAARSPFLVKCFSAYQTDHLLVYVMEYSLGGDLRTHLGQAGRFAESTVAVIGMQIVLGLEHLHSFGVIYRDLKPENVLMSMNGKVQLADFGLSKFLTKRRTGFLARLMRSNRSAWGTTRTSCGTPMYQAPEMIRNRPHGLEVDWWALGILIFELLTGRPPFVADSVAEIHRLIFENQPKFPAYLSQEAVLLISSFLQSSKTKRLGCGSSGVASVKQQRFFLTKGLSWDLLNESFVYHSAMNRNDVQLFRSGALARADVLHESRFVPEHIIPSKSCASVDGFTRVPNEALDHFATITESVKSQRSDPSLPATIQTSEHQSEGDDNPKQPPALHLAIQ